MRLMQDDAPSTASLADRCSRSLRPWDPRVNAVHDDLNAALPRLWWPLSVPSRDDRLGAAEHALYAVHAAVGIGLAAALTRRRGVASGGVLLAVLSWAVFSGAWDRRADAQATTDDRWAR